MQQDFEYNAVRKFQIRLGWIIQVLVFACVVFFIISQIFYDFANFFLLLFLLPFLLYIFIIILNMYPTFRLDDQGIHLSVPLFNSFIPWSDLILIHKLGFIITRHKIVFCNSRRIHHRLIGFWTGSTTPAFIIPDVIDDYERLVELIEWKIKK